MLVPEVENALNQQLNAEIYSSYLYVSMAAQCKADNLDGFAAWLETQAQEEMTHAAKFYNFISQRGGRVRLAAIEGPQVEWETPLAVFEDTLAHEQKVSAMINDLMDIAIAQKDHATQIFLQWFVTEQVEEEESVGMVLGKIKRVKDSAQGMYLLDQELGQRQPGPLPGTTTAAE
ncbi:ferritin [uncultured Desulfobacter sp.]|uniref:ferritin n=1 Tax=uncultured Desulfobacter sp. TaxID=240139 RepID=UPI002AAA7376|nr:ferritin [uncultured Desulfobacter sp.]